MDVHIIELSSYDNIQALVEDASHNDLSMVLSQTEVVEVFIAWQIDVEKIGPVFVLPKMSFFGKLINTRQAAKVYDDNRAIKHDSQNLGRVAAKGYAAIFSTDSNLEHLKTFFQAFHYSTLNEEHSTLEDSTLVKYADNENFRDLIEQACASGVETFCCFGYDSDPIYLISKV